ncbi:MAG: S-methyl-5'-thioadenosine phosphorylase [Kofleriaceae bacterium]
MQPAIGVLGGSGFYDLPGAHVLETVTVDTPFGAPSDALAIAQVGDRRLVFLPRHGRGHRLLPSEVNARANLYAFKQLGATHVISISAVGSLREAIAPGHVVVPRQYIDRTVSRPASYFGHGVVAHVSMADPVCARVASELAVASRAEGAQTHDRATYVCIEGPQFGTRAESELMRSWGGDIVGMTMCPEVRLAREAELCYATLALSTDYDCWHTSDVTMTDVFAVMRANVERARAILVRAVAALDPATTCACQTSLDGALATVPEAIDVSVRTRLAAILARRLA